MDVLWIMCASKVEVCHWKLKFFHKIWFIVANSWSCWKRGAGNSYGRWTHFILNIKDWLTFLCQSIKVWNTLHGFETMKLFNIFILLLHMDADGLRAFYYLVQDSKCICVLSHWSPLQDQTICFELLVQSKKHFNPKQIANFFFYMSFININLVYVLLKPSRKMLIFSIINFNYKICVFLYCSLV